MKQELEERLAQEFPFMRRKNGYDEQGMVRDLYGAFGCECGDGWFELLRELCAEITSVYEQEGMPVDLVVMQVKEKFATLRFYYHREGRNPGLQALDFLGGPSLRLRPNQSELDRKISDVVSKYEEKSGTVCERCGKSGSVRTDLRWLLTLCDDCYAAIKK